MTKKTRRVLLLGAALLLVGGNLWWFTRPPEPRLPDFELGAIPLQAQFPAGELAHLPMFDSGQGKWLVEGRPVASLAALRRHVTGADMGGTDGNYLLVRVPEPGSADLVRAMLLSLSEQGECVVALTDGSATPDSSGRMAAPLHRIVTVRDDSGEMHRCNAIQSSAAPSSASR
jgi:hypothetical protein